MSSILLYLGGDGPNFLDDSVLEIAAVIAADSGLELAAKHQVDVNLVVGDMDSVNPELLRRYEENGTHVSRFNRDKDETDFELALLAAKNYVADSLIIIGGGAKRLDHLLANIAIATGPLTENWESQMITANEKIYVCRAGNKKTLNEKFGTPFAIIAIGGPAVVTTRGVKWELTDFELSPHTSRGISNEFKYDEATIEVASGKVIAIVEN